MPDASDPRGRAPLDWSDAFGALPPATPPADAWSCLSARLDARGTPTAPAPVAHRERHRRSRVRNAGWLGAATAAALALVVAWPRHDARPDAPAPRGTTAPVVPAAPAVDVAVAAHANAPGRDVTAIALPKAVEVARKPRLASRSATRRDTPTQPAANAAESPRADDARLDALYAESARLEALLALARDDRVASAGAALLASELDAQVAAIDAGLARTGLDADRRAALWQARVDALRQVAGFESTQRVLASQGDAGALLVSVD